MLLDKLLKNDPKEKINLNEHFKKNCDQRHKEIMDMKNISSKEKDSLDFISNIMYVADTSFPKDYAISYVTKLCADEIMSNTYSLEGKEMILKLRSDYEKSKNDF